MFDVKTTLNISDLTFYPSQTTHGYDLYASAIDKEDILFLNLVTGKFCNKLHFCNSGKRVSRLKYTRKLWRRKKSEKKKRRNFTLSTPFIIHHGI